MCVVKFRWRSKVLSTSPCTVCLLDSGLVKTVNKDELFKAPSILENVPAQGILMQFAPGQNYAVQQYDILSVKPTGEVIALYLSHYIYISYFVNCVYCWTFCVCL